MSNLRFYSFRNEWDLEQIEQKGYVTVDEDLNDNPVYDLAKDYFKSEGVMWCYITDNAKLEREGCLDYSYRIEFKPDKFLKFTPMRHELLYKGAEVVYNEVYDRFKKNHPECKNYSELITTFMREDFCCTDEFLKFCGTEKDYKDNYIGVVPYIRKEDIIEIIKLEDEPIKDVKPLSLF